MAFVVPVAAEGINTSLLGCVVGVMGLVPS